MLTWATPFCELQSFQSAFLYLKNALVGSRWNRNIKTYSQMHPQPADAHSRLIHAPARQG